MEALPFLPSWIRSPPLRLPDTSSSSSSSRVHPCVVYLSFHVSQLIMAIPQPSKTPAPCLVSGGDSDPFAFLDQVPSPAIGGGQSEQHQDVVSHLFLFLIVPTNYRHALALPDNCSSWRLPLVQFLGSSTLSCVGQTRAPECFHGALFVSLSVYSN